MLSTFLCFILVKVHVHVRLISRHVYHIFTIMSLLSSPIHYSFKGKTLNRLYGIKRTENGKQCFLSSLWFWYRNILYSKKQQWVFLHFYLLHIVTHDFWRYIHKEGSISLDWWDNEATENMQHHELVKVMLLKSPVSG